MSRRRSRARTLPGCKRCSRPPSAASPGSLRPARASWDRWPGSWPRSRDASPAAAPPNIFTTLGQHPRLFRAWLRYSAHLMPFGELSRRDTELVILRVAWQCRSSLRVAPARADRAARGTYPGRSRRRGRRSCGGRLHGATADAAGRLRRAARRGARSRTRPGAPSRRISCDREAIELCLLIGHYQGLASAIGGLGIQIEQG